MQELPKRPNFNDYEPRLYQEWEENRLFTAKVNPAKKPFTILLPPPNANAALHVGHALYVIEDILCRYHRMLGDETLFLPGTDHAGIETQFVLEKHLRKEGKSRFDYDRDTLYQMVHEFVEENRGIATKQLRKLGFSLDWSREKYTLDPEILKTVLATFKKLHADSLIYRDQRLVNYCTNCGTGFSNLEIEHKEEDALIYHLDYQTITIATTRPETIFADVAIAVNPTDERYQNLIGQNAVIPIINKEIPIIADENVDKEFGTGALKITPGHDPLDYEIGEKHNLEKISVIGRDGKLINTPEKYIGKRVYSAREMVIADLREEGTLVDEKPLHHSIATCYRCKRTIEPLLIPQWYIKTKTLVADVLQSIENNDVNIFPERFKNELIRWLETAPDWNISRQIVWGPQIPVWYDMDKNPQIDVTFLAKNEKIVSGKFSELIKKYHFDEIKDGLQSLIAPIGSTYQLEPEPTGDSPHGRLLQETDTFDTWFSSGQWPLTTLGYPDSPEFNYFYPTNVLDTMWDILPFWVMRMLMLGIYRTGEVPFKNVHLHARVVDKKGQKMSKSKGNVVNPMEIVEQYGADVLRMALVFGVAPAADVAIGQEKLIGMRNFVTKLWNVSRFIFMRSEEIAKPPTKTHTELIREIELKPEDKEIITKCNKLIEKVTTNLDHFQFSHASESLHDFIWNDFASTYLESTKDRDDQAAIWTLLVVLEKTIKLLHPFMPFITEEIYQHLPIKTNSYLTTAPWPEPIKV